MATIIEVAKHAGVSIASVSRVVNSSRSVSKDVTDRVTQACKELNYIPNTLAKSMRTRKSNYIGIIISDIADSFFTELYTTIQMKAKKEGYKTILINGPFLDLEDTIQNLYHWNIEGVIICFANPDRKWKSVLQRYEKNIPFVIMETVVSYENYSKVYVNVEEGMYAAVKYLIDKGHRRIAYFRGDMNLPDGRYDGYLRALKEAGIVLDKKIVIECEYDIAGGKSAVSKILLLRQRPTAIVTINDTIAFGAVKYMLENGIKIPEEISIIGFDDNPMAQITHPELSTVRIPIRTLADSAYTILMKNIKSANNRIYYDKIETELMLRETTT